MQVQKFVFYEWRNLGNPVLLIKRGLTALQWGAFLTVWNITIFETEHCPLLISWKRISAVNQNLHKYVLLIVLYNYVSTKKKLKNGMFLLIVLHNFLFCNNICNKKEKMVFLVKSVTSICHCKEQNPYNHDVTFQFYNS